MQLAVFQEFCAPSVLEEVRSIPISVDVAKGPCAFAKSVSEIDVVETNAKLVYAAQSISDAELDEAVRRLEGCGFEVVHRNPVTSAGCPMRDRVILKYRRAPAATATPAA